jgi:probable rRNA maturation factor
MEQSQYLNKIHFYGSGNLLNGKIKNLKYIIYKIIKDHQFHLESIEFNFINDQEILQININSLNHNYYTDIITFDYRENKKIIGDIYISLERIKDNSSQFKTSMLNELLRVIFHGVLHLAGYKDKTKIEKEKMTEMENIYLLAFNNVPRGTSYKKSKKRLK